MICLDDNINNLVAAFNATGATSVTRKDGKVHVNMPFEAWDIPLTEIGTTSELNIEIEDELITALKATPDTTLVGDENDYDYKGFVTAVEDFKTRIFPEEAEGATSVSTDFFKF